MSARRDPKSERALSPVSRRVFLAATPAALVAGAASLGACGGGGYANYANAYADYVNAYADCVYCDMETFPGSGIWYDYVCCDGALYCDGFCA